MKEGKAERSLPNRKEHILLSSIPMLQSYYHASISDICHWVTIWCTPTKMCQGQQVKTCEGLLCSLFDPLGQSITVQEKVDNICR